MNRPLRIGDKVTFRADVLSRLRDVYPHLPPSDERWLSMRDCELRVVGRTLERFGKARRPKLAIACDWSVVTFSAWAHDMRLDNRQRWWKAMDRREDELRAIRKAKRSKNNRRRKAQ